MRRHRQSIAALAWLACLVGCAQPPPVVPPGAPPTIDNYVIEFGDEIGIRVLGQAGLDEQGRVGPDGRIEMSPIGSVVAAGHTVPEVDAEVTSRLADYVRRPDVTVFVRRFANRNVYVGGQVKRPGIAPLRSSMTALMAIFTAGGFRNTARQTQVVVLRDSGDGRGQAHLIDATVVLTGGVPDMILAPYDVVFVPMSKIARVNLAVEQYIKRMLPFSLFANANYSWLNDQTDSNPAVIFQ